MKRNKYIFYLLSFLQGLVFYGAYSVIYRQSRGLAMSQIFLLESIFMILMLIFEVPWGVIGDRIGYKKTIVISFGIYALSKVVFYTAHSFFGFLMEAVLGAIAISGISGCDSAMLYLSIDESESEKIFGRYAAFGTAGFFVSSGLSGLIINYSVDFLALATIIPYMIAFVLSFMLADVKKEKNEADGEEKKESTVKTFKSVLHSGNVLIFVAAAAIISESTHSICVFLNQPLYLKSGISLGWFGILTALMQVAALSSAIAHKFTARIGSMKLLIISVAMISLSSLILIISRTWYITIFLIFITEGAFALTQPIGETIKNKTVESINRATVLSVYAMLSDIIAAVINIVIATVSDISLEASVAMCFALDILAIILLIVYFKRSRKEETAIS